MSRGKTQRRLAHMQHHGRDSHKLAQDKRAKLRAEAARAVRVALRLIRCQRDAERDA